MALRVSDVMISHEEIQAMCKRMGAEITRDYQGKELLLVAVLRGAFVFMADLIRYIDLPCRVDFMKVSSYSDGMTTSGEVKILQDLDENIAGRDVIIVEDIIDSGLTLYKLRQVLQTRNPNSLAVCAAFDKPDRRRADIFVDYVGKQIPDEFIVGYGLDYGGLYRNLPDIRYMEDDGE
ncbi:MAG: hypoxanthine phosphoribosyltransferase [Clostridia bacterium]|nr:hypoxanthine phosphoribosyltransferase [Clostridia bacterium]NLF21462.1 hypoxanthine phosphoribosyltransferase [Clostridiaceae bacterium]